MRIMCAVLYHFITSVGVWNHHCNDETKLFHHHKELPHLHLCVSFLRSHQILERMDIYIIWVYVLRVSHLVPCPQKALLNVCESKDGRMEGASDPWRPGRVAWDPGQTMTMLSSKPVTRDLRTEPSSLWIRNLLYLLVHNMLADAARVRMVRLVRACMLSCFSRVGLFATLLDHSPRGSSVHGILWSTEEMPVSKTRSLFLTRSILCVCFLQTSVFNIKHTLADTNGSFTLIYKTYCTS